VTHPDPILDPDPGFLRPKIEKIQLKISFFVKNCNYLSLDLHTVKDVQATGEAFISQKRTSSTSKDEIY
jgi:hypothetical protein